MNGAQKKKDAALGTPVATQVVFIQADNGRDSADP